MHDANALLRLHGEKRGHGGAMEEKERQLGGAGVEHSLHMREKNRGDCVWEENRSKETDYIHATVEDRADEGVGQIRGDWLHARDVRRSSG